MLPQMPPLLTQQTDCTGLFEVQSSPLSSQASEQPLNPPCLSLQSKLRLLSAYSSAPRPAKPPSKQRLRPPLTQAVK